MADRQTSSGRFEKDDGKAVNVAGSSDFHLDLHWYEL